MINKPDELKLVYILKIGYNSKNEGLYEFIFSKDIDQILDLKEELMWDQKPASAPDNAETPDDEMVDALYELRTDKFDLFCLHESDIHSYMDGVHTIHCLAYEQEKEEDYDYESLYENTDSPLLVFHFGMTFEEVADLLYERDIVLNKNSIKKSKVNE